MSATTERSASEVTHLRGKTAEGGYAEIQVTPDGSPACNYGFDVTPARLVTAAADRETAACGGVLWLRPPN